MATPAKRSPKKIYGKIFKRPMNLVDLGFFAVNKEMFINFLMDEGLIYKEMTCYQCENPMKYSMKAHGLGRFHCTKIATHVHKKQVHISATKNSYFENSRISAERALVLSYCFVHQFTHEAAIRESSFPLEWGKCSIEDIRTSPETVTDWYSYGREVMAAGLENEERLGGPNMVVEIVELKFAKSKFKTGRYIEGNSVLIMMEHPSEDSEERVKIVLVPGNEHTKENFLKIIEEHIVPDSIIFSNCLREFNCLIEEGYFHFKVNYENDNFEFVYVGKQRNMVESLWKSTKRSKHNVEKICGLLDGNLIEYLWRKKYMGVDLFHVFLQNVKKLYSLKQPPQVNVDTVDIQTEELEVSVDPPFVLYGENCE